MADGEEDAGANSSGFQAAVSTEQAAEENRDPEMAAMGPVHLIVMQHGLWGHPDNLKALEGLVLKHADNCGDLACPVRTINSHVNFEVLTYDGIDVCG